MQVYAITLSIGVDDDANYFLYVNSDAQNLALPIDIPERLRDIGIRLLEARQPVFYDDPHELGNELGAVLYPPEVQRFLSAAADRALRAKHRLQIQLQITVPELAALPWEWAIIPLPQPWAPARTDDFPVIRRSGAALPARAIPVDGPLRVLLCVGDGDGDTIRVIESLLSQDIAQHRIAVTVCVVANAVDIELALQQQLFHVVHCFAPVVLDADKVLTMRFAEPIDSADLHDLLATYPLIGLFAVTPIGPPTAELLAYPHIYAATMLGATLPVAISASGTLSPGVATRFAATLYNAISAGTPVDLALSHARRTLSHFDVDTIWGYPQLRMVPGSEQIFAIAPPPARTDWLRALGALLAVVVALLIVIVLGRWLHGDPLPHALRQFFP